MKRAELENIHKIFETPADSAGAVQQCTALDGVTLAFSPGEIHTILGENGAGKSTLVHILSGLHTPSSGTIRIGGETFCFRSPSEALSAGIAMVHQRPLLSEEISVLENIILGSPGFFLHRNRRKKEIEKLRDEWQLDLDLHAPVKNLNPRERLATALLGALYRKPDFLVLDEPTASLATEERERFFSAMRNACDRSLGIILITHKLDEALRLSDRISILKQGKLVYSSPVREPVNGIPVTGEFLAGILDPDHLIATRTARGTNGLEQPDSPVSFRATGITAQQDDLDPVFDISFSVAPHSITGIFGHPGSGIETLEEILTGMIEPDTGDLTIGGNTLSGRNITSAELRRHGVAFVPSNRAFRGSHPELTVFDMLTVYRNNRLFPDAKANTEFVRKILEDEQLPFLPDRRIKTLSGGQLQRLILARELASRPDVLILAEPEWGLDIKNASLLRERLRAAAERGMTIIILTDDPETVRDPFFTGTLILREGRLA